MDVIIEFFLELLFDVPLDLAMGSKKLKTWVKTTIYGILCGLFCVALMVLSVLAWLEWRWYIAATVSVLSILITVYGIIRGVRGHRKDWKNW